VDKYQTEEEQVEALRRWWDENGRSTMVAIVLAVGAGFGWQAWQERQQESAEAASIYYEELLQAVQLVGEDKQEATIRHLAEGLKEDYSGSTYASFAALHLARLAVMEDDLVRAEEELRWVLTAKPTDEVRMLAELRLARVVAARGNLQGAMDILLIDEAGGYEPAYAEARGDIYLQQGEPDKAIAEYQAALALAAASGGGAGDSLQLKLESLTPVPARDVLVEEEVVEEAELEEAAVEEALTEDAVPAVEE
jgi:predicted negative regulator of RcsB-dependent stress response